MFYDISKKFLNIIIYDVITQLQNFIVNVWCSVFIVNLDIKDLELTKNFMQLFIFACKFIVDHKTFLNLYADHQKANSRNSLNFIYCSTFGIPCFPFSTVSHVPWISKKLQMASNSGSDQIKWNQLENWGKMTTEILSALFI